MQSLQQLLDIVLPAESGFPERQFELLGEIGALANALPVREGGLGYGTDPSSWAQLLRFLRCLGFVSLPVARIFEGHINALNLVETFGTADQLQSLAAQVHQHRFVSGVWNTDLPASPVKIERLGVGRLILHGSKAFASGAGYIHAPLITADWTTGEGRQMILLSGISLSSRIDRSSWKPFGMVESASFTVNFGGLEVTTSSLIGQPGDYYREPVFSAGAIRFTAAQLGGAERLLSEARSYLQSLHREKDPHQLARLSEMVVAVETGRQWIRSAAEAAAAWFHLDPAPLELRQLLTQTSMTRVAIEQVCMRVMELVERSVGARGLLEPRAFARIIADLRMYLRQPGTDAALTNIGVTLCEIDYPNPFFN